MSRHWGHLVFCLALLSLAGGIRAEEFETIQLPSVYHTYGSALTGDSNTLFVIATTGVVLVYDVEQDRYVRSIDLRDQVIRPTVGAVARNKLYIQSFRDIAVVDAVSFELRGLIALSPFLGSSYGSVVPSPSGHRVYTVGGSTTAVTVIDAATDGVIARIAVGGENTGMGMSVDGRRLYVSNSEENRLTIIDTDRLEVIAVVPFFQNHGLLDYPTAVRVDPTDGTVFVAYVDESSRGRVSVLAPDGQFLRSLSVGRFSTGLDLTEDGRYLILGCGVVLDPSNGQRVGEFETTVNGTSAISVSPDGMRAYVCNVNDTYVKAVEGFQPPLRLSGRPGEILTLSLDLPQEAGRLYQVGAALGTDEGIPLEDGRVVPTDMDDLLRFSVKDGGRAFVRFSGTLNEQGQAIASIDPSQAFPGRAVGTKVYVCFVTLDEELSRSDVRVISNVVSFTVTQ